jgi:hypothetical protein
MGGQNSMHDIDDTFQSEKLKERNHLEVGRRFDLILTHVKDIVCEDVEWMCVAQDREQ